MNKTQPYFFEHQVDTSKTKKVLHDEIFKKNYDGEDQEIPYGDLPTDLQPTDILVYNSDEGHQSENNSWDPFTEIMVFRPRIETNEEQIERLEKSRLYIEERKKGRYKTYLRLKEEFETDQETAHDDVNKN